MVPTVYQTSPLVIRHSPPEAQGHPTRRSEMAACRLATAASPSLPALTLQLPHVRDLTTSDK